MEIGHLKKPSQLSQKSLTLTFGGISGSKSHILQIADVNGYTMEKMSFTQPDPPQAKQPFK